ncbi:MAG TPA: caspase family protein [Coleofasciculaceae cyanobacterium]
MSRINRRHFLQFAGSTLATLGLSQLDIMWQGDALTRVLAQSTPRKLALLVGINEYQVSPLYGCVTDANLQKQLLMHRFGFNEKDILVLTNQQATRQGILTAFEEHLIKQAKPGDVVVFHFSGHGSQVPDPDCDISPDCTNSTLVPIDSLLPTDSPNPGSAAPQIMGHTLFLLMHALQTENVTVVLDSCHSGGGTRGNFRVRSINNSARLSRDRNSLLQTVKAEQEYQQQWLSKLNLSPEEFKRLRREGVAKGVAIASTRRDQLAADAPFDGFSAGAFTYLMTQYLWQQLGSESFIRTIPNVARSTTRISFTGQQPIIEYKPGSDNPKRPVYFINEQTPPAEAVITNIVGNRAELWLGGLAPDSLAAFKAGAILSVVDSQGRDQGRVQLEKRDGLVGQAMLLDAAQPGAFLQERSRSIPSNLALKIGLDPSLGSEAGTAKQALATIPRMEALPLQQQEVQYIFGRMTPTYQQQLRSIQTANIPEAGCLGLFSPALELIPDSFGTKSETVPDAIKRLHSKLNSLLAAHIIKTVLNTNSSRLNIVAAMQLERSGQIIANPFTPRGSFKKSTSTNPSTPVVAVDSRKLPLGTAVQIQVTNNETSPLYVSVLVIDPTGEMSVIFPNQWTAAEEITLVKAGETKKIPDPDQDSFRLVTQEPKGVAEVLILASRTPLRKALKTLRDVAASQSGGGQRGGPVTLRSSPQQNEAGKVIDNLLDDLTSDTRGSTRSSIPSRNTDSASAPSDRSIETNQLAALSITFEVI